MTEKRKTELDAILVEFESDPPDPPKRMGFGKQPIPPKQLPPIPTARPVREETVTDGMLEPAPGPPESIGPVLPRTAQQRSYSPAPWETPGVVDELEREAESRGDRLVRPKRSLSPPPTETTTVRHEYGLERGTRNLIILLAFGTAGSGGLAIYGAFKEPPPAVQDAPKKVDDQQRELSRVREDLSECRSDVREIEKDFRRIDRKLEQTIEDVEALGKRVPKVNP